MALDNAKLLAAVFKMSKFSLARLQPLAKKYPSAWIFIILYLWWYYSDFFYIFISLLFFWCERILFCLKKSTKNDFLIIFCEIKIGFRAPHRWTLLVLKMTAARWRHAGYFFFAFVFFDRNQPTFSSHKVLGINTGRVYCARSLIHMTLQCETRETDLYFSVKRSFSEQCTMQKVKKRNSQSLDAKVRFLIF